jgi:thiol-disulfide isomerase/thioredoxin
MSAVWKLLSVSGRAAVRHPRVALAVAVAVVVAGGFLAYSVLTADKTPTFRKEYGLTLLDYQGHEVRLSEFKNKIVVAYAWASWCPYCGAEIEHLAQLREKYGANIQILGVNRGESLAVAQDFTSHLHSVDGVLFLLDPDDAFFKMIGGYAMPETVFVRSNGEILYHQRGPMRYEEAEAQLQAILVTP